MNVRVDESRVEMLQNVRHEDKIRYNVERPEYVRVGDGGNAREIMGGEGQSTSFHSPHLIPTQPNSTLQTPLHAPHPIANLSRPHTPHSHTTHLIPQPTSSNAMDSGMVMSVMTMRAATDISQRMLALVRGLISH